MTQPESYSVKFTLSSRSPFITGINGPHPGGITPFWLMGPTRQYTECDIRTTLILTPLHSVNLPLRRYAAPGDVGYVWAPPLRGSGRRRLRLGSAATRLRAT
jgi:hypothetical protein